MSEGRAVIANVLSEGQRRGEIAVELNTAEVALQMQQVLLGTLMLWSLYGEPELAACIENSFQLFWRAIATKGREQKL
jgi:hypothetical protein